jgi:hypothetical protein
MYEEYAINDLMEFAGVGDYQGRGRPNVGCLIHAQKKLAYAAGFESVQSPSGCSSRSEWDVSCIGRQENVQIEVAPGDMDLPADIWMQCVRRLSVSAS